MGYTHYWYRKPTIPKTKFSAIVTDFNKIVLALADMGVALGDGRGEGVPEITSDTVVFNGYANCGHPENHEVVIPWPAQGASGVDTGPQSEKVSGYWFAGAQLSTRTCDGDCSYETFAFERVWEVPDYQLKEYPKGSDGDGLWFVCCKTAFRPYDLAVTAFLLIAKHHLGKAIRVTSDGEDEHWQDAKRLCYTHLGYGPEYAIVPVGQHASKYDSEQKMYYDYELAHRSASMFADMT